VSESTQWYCPHCNAKQMGPAESCWLCDSSLSLQQVRLPPPGSFATVEPERFSFSLATMLLMITLASVGMGLLVALPGLGVLACIVMVPVLVRTVRVVRKREARGKEVSSSEKISLFVGSFVVSTVLAIVVGVAAFCSFCGVCLTLVSSSDPKALPIALGVCGLGIGAIFLAFRISKWNRQRFQQEIEAD